GDTSSTRAAKAQPASTKASKGPVNTEGARSRLFALPQRSGNVNQASLSGQIDQLLGQKVPGYETFKSAFASAFQFDPNTMQMKPLKVGSHVTGGSVIGQIGQAPVSGAPH